MHEWSADKHIQKYSQIMEEKCFEVKKTKEMQQDERKWEGRRTVVIWHCMYSAS